MTNKADISHNSAIIILIIMSILDSEEPPLFKTASRAYVIGKLQEEEESHMTDQKQHTFAVRIQKFLVTSRIQDKLEFVNAALSFILTLLYAISTYWEHSIIPNIIYFELPILLYMLSDFLLNFYISQNRLYYIISFQSLVTYITVLPDLLMLAGIITDINTITTYELPFWKVFRIFSVSRVQIVFVRRNMSLARVYFRLAFSLGSIVLLFACIMLMIENKYYIRPTLISVAQKLALDPDAELTYQEQHVPPLPYVFHDTLYYVVVTLTTCGYGDITPKTSYGMMLFVLVIMSSMFVLASQFPDLEKIVSLHSSFATISYKTSPNKKHVLLCGDFSHEFFLTFLTEFFNPDHGKIKNNIVICRTSEPSAEMKEILHNPNYDGRIQYIKGDSILPHDLKRCLVHKALSCLIMCDQSSQQNGQQQDYRNILIAFAVKKYSAMMLNKENEGDSSGIRVCLQLMRPDHKKLYYSGQRDAKKIDQIVCIEELKLQLLAKSATCPGIINIIWSLLTSDSNTDEDDCEFGDEFIEYINKQKRTNSNAFSVNIEHQEPHIADKKEIEMEELLQKNLKKYDKWQMNYLSGTKYEIYRVPFQRQKFQGLKYKDVVMIIYHKMNITLIGIELKVGNQVKVFVNPSEYIFQETDHWGYVIHHEKPNFKELNEIDLEQESAENYFLLHHINKQESKSSKKEQIKQHKVLAQMMDDYDNSNVDINFENYFTTKKPQLLSEARISELPNSIEGHILVCGIVKGIKNLILPLRLKTLGTQKRPIVILCNGTMGDEAISGDTYFWNEINRFEDIFIIKGSALNPADLEKARVSKAKAIIILAKSSQQSKKQGGPQVLDAGQIFMYKTIEANYKNVSIVTELAQMSAIAFIINESGQKDSEQANYFASKPFAAGEIFVGSLLNSLMCQAFYNPKMTDLLDQFIMGSASTSAEVYKLYQKMNLAMCSLNIMEVPKGCQDMTYASVFEFCVKRNQVPIGVFRRHNDDEFAQSTGAEHQDNPGKSKPHVWLHPPKNLELSVHDELFILCEKNPKGETTLKNMENFGTFKAKNDVTKTQDNNMLKLTKLEGQLQDLVYTAKELGIEMTNSKQFVARHFDLKLRSELEANEQL